MRKVFLVMNISLDGYVEDANHDLSWSQAIDPNFEAFSSERSARTDTILLGRKTFDMMAGFWPTPMADQVAPQVAAFMNGSRKLAISHAQFQSDWKNTTVISQNVLNTLAEIKRQPGGDIIILGSNNLCVSLMQENLIDEFQIVVNPVVLGGGTPLFAGLPHKARLTLAESRTFPSGKTMLIYKPAN